MKPNGKPTMEYFAEFIRMTLVQIYEQVDKQDFPGQFKAGVSLAIEEASARLIGEFFDTYHERIKNFLHEESVSILAKEFEEAMNEQVAAGKCDLIIAADGEKRYSPHPE